MGTAGAVVAATVPSLVESKAMTDTFFKIDIRWPETGRADKRERTETRDPSAALAAFARLLARPDLDGQNCAARLMVDGKSLYYSEFNKPVGRGRIALNAPLRLDVTREEAQRLASWTGPEAAPNPQRGGAVAPGAAVATVEGGTEQEAAELAKFFLGRGWTVRDTAGQVVPMSHVARSLLVFLDADD